MRHHPPHPTERDPLEGGCQRSTSADPWPAQPGPQNTLPDDKGHSHHQAQAHSRPPESRQQQSQHQPTGHNQGRLSRQSGQSQQRPGQPSALPRFPGPQPGLHQPIGQRLRQVEAHTRHQAAISPIGQRIPGVYPARHQQPLGDVRTSHQSRHVDQDQRPRHERRLPQRQPPRQHRIQDTLITVGRHVAVTPPTEGITGNEVRKLPIVSPRPLWVPATEARAHQSKRHRVAIVAGQRHTDVGQRQHQHDAPRSYPAAHHCALRPRLSHRNETPIPRPYTSPLTPLIAAPTIHRGGR